MGCQTQDSEKQKDSLQDMVSAFLMQNKFLNKEVLELNQLRQQGRATIRTETRAALVSQGLKSKIFPDKY